METKITRDIFETYLDCKYKAYLILTEKRGEKTDYELLTKELRQDVSRAATQQIKQNYPDAEDSVTLTRATLQHGSSFLLGATLDDDKTSLMFDGLKRLDGASRLGDFHYVPVLFFEFNRIHNAQRLLLDLYALYLSQQQGVMPALGLIWHGKHCRSTKVNLSPDPR